MKQLPRGSGEEDPRAPAEHGFLPTHVFRNARPGFSAELSPDALEAVRRHPAVEYVEHEAPAGAVQLPSVSSL